MGIVRGMVLVDSVGIDYWPVPQVARLRDPRWDEFIMRVNMRMSIRASLEQGMVRKDRISDDLVAAYAGPFEDEEGKRAYLRAARALDYRDTMRILEDLTRISVPTLIIWGEEDVYLPPHQGRRLSKAIGGSRFVVVSNVGHFFPEDDPELIAALVNGFMDLVK
jgi:pimeloyl-ACP methyl ester carboxylesterase